MRLNAGLDWQNRRKRRRLRAPDSSGVSGQVGTGIGIEPMIMFRKRGLKKVSTAL
jgi:hypothetical protein